MQDYKVIYRSKNSGSTKSLLKKGMVPGIIYGKNTDPTKIAFENKVLQKLMYSGGFYSKILELDEPKSKDHRILFNAAPRTRS